MDADGIVELLAPLAPALAAGSEVVDERANRMWAALASSLARIPRALAAWRSLTGDPDDLESRRVLRAQLALLMAREPDVHDALEMAWWGLQPGGGPVSAGGARAVPDDPAESEETTRRGFDTPAPAAPDSGSPVRRLQVWLDPADPERPWLVGLAVAIGFRTPGGGVSAVFPEATVFAAADEQVTLDVVATSEDFVVESGPQTLRLGRVGPSRAVVHIALGVGGLDAGPRVGTVTVHLFKEGNFAAGLVVGLRVDGQEARIVESQELGRPLLRPGSLRPRQLSLVVRRSVEGYAVLAFGAVRADFTLRLTPEHVERMRLDACAALGALVGHRTFQDELTIPESLAREALDALARTGHDLFRTLFYDRGDPAAMEFGDRLCKLADEATLTIQVVSDDIFLPWGMLYLADSVVPGAVEAQRFLGFRHVVEHVLVGAQGESAPPELPTSPQLTVGLGVALDIDTDFEMTVVADQLASWKRHEQHTAATGSVVRVRTRTTADEVRAALNDPHGAEDIWYFYCHAVAGSLADIGGADAAYLQLTGGTRIGLGTLKASSLRPRPMPRRPLVLVNACGSATMSPLFYGGFLPYFLGRGARGVVGTECDVPALFAAAWAERFFRAFLGGGRTLGATLLDLRNEFLTIHRNPLGLLYALYCDADTVAMPGALLGTESW